MATRGFGDRDLLAFQVGNGLDRRILRNEDSLRARRWRFLRDKGEFGARRLRENRDGIGDVGAEIDVAGVESFELRQAAAEFVPRDLHTERSERLLQSAIELEDRDQCRRALKADAQRPARRRRLGGGNRARHQERQRGEKKSA
jgi:hypothetical protein